MNDEQRTRADEQMARALDADPSVRDPRPFYRPVLKHLRETDPEGFSRALGYYESTLVPEVAGGADPLACWLEYGRLLADALGPGETVAVDATGRAHSVGVEEVGASQGLLMHLPNAGSAPVLVLRYPVPSSPHQDAAVEVLAAGRVTASLYEA
jgi:hypothetical protein